MLINKKLFCLPFVTIKFFLPPLISASLSGNSNIKITFKRCKDRGIEKIIKFKFIFVFLKKQKNFKIIKLKKKRERRFYG